MYLKKESIYIINNNSISYSIINSITKKELRFNCNLSNNLHSLLRNNGNVLCSRFHEFPEKVEEEERRIFEENFEFHDYGKNAGYCYIKK